MGETRVARLGRAGASVLVGLVVTVATTPSPGAPPEARHPVVEQVLRLHPRLGDSLGRAGSFEPLWEAAAGLPAGGFRRVAAARAADRPGSVPAGIGAPVPGESDGAGGVEVFLPTTYDDVFVGRTGAQRVSLRAVGAAQSRGHRTEGAVVYEQPWPGVDSLQVATEAGNEELLLLSDGRAPRAFVYEVVEAEGVGEVYENGGQVRFGRTSGTGPEIALSRPWLIDAAGRTVENGVRWEIARDGSRTEIRLVVAAEALSYPALIDPGFTTTGSMSVARSEHTATLLPNGKVLVAGGGASLSSAELYDPTHGTWAATGSLATGRRTHTGTLLADGRVLVAGGYGPSGIVSSAEVFNPATGTWSVTGSLATGRAEHTATLLADGRVLVAGGYGPTGFLSSAEVYNPATGTWSAAGSLATGRTLHTATMLLGSGKVLVAGGVGGAGILASAELYDPTPGTWSATGNLVSPRYYQSATLLANGKVLVQGGRGSSGVLGSTEVYDPVPGTWSPAVGGTPRYGHSTSLLTNGKVLAAGGYNGSSFLNYANLFDPQTSTWGGGQAFAGGRASHTATVLPSGRVLLAGGSNAGATSLVYDPTTPSWSATASLTVGRSYPTTTVLPSGKVLTVGGYQAVNTGSTAADLYDHAAGTWTPTAALSPGRVNHAAVLLASGKVLVAGGWTGSAALANAQLYDPAAGTWSATGSLVTTRYAHTATLLSNGKVLVAGGSPNGSSSTASAELYDPTTGTWSATGSMTGARLSHKAVLLPNGKVLAFGGSNGSTRLATAELYDPSTGTWSATGSLATGRSGPGAVLLPNGRVMAAGGYGPSGALASVEIYNPATGTWSAANGMSSVRYVFDLVLLGSGHVLAAGGYSGMAIVNGTEIYDPSTGLWTAGPTMPAGGRFGYGSALLPSGRLLVVGGENPMASYRPESYLLDPGLGFQDAWRPVASGVPAVISPGVAVSVTGTGFRGLSEASSGGFQGSATNYPLVQLRRLDNGETRFLPLGTSPGFSATSFTSSGAWTMNHGPAVVTVFVNGIPSTTAYTLIQPAQTLTVSKSGSGTGSVSSAPSGVSCGATCQADFAYAATVALTPAADPGSQFVGWSGACTGSGSCSVFMNGPKSVTATFCALQTWYQDLDGDGHGNSGVTTQSCTQPPGYVALSDDCDDSRATVYTGAPELCDGLDNDCDGTVDEGAFTGASGVTALSSPSCGYRVTWPTCASLVYNVYRSTNPSFVPDASSRIASCVNGTSYEDSTGLSGGTTYYYVVRSEAGSGGGGACGGIEDTNLTRVSAAPLACGPTPEPVQAFALTARDQQVVLQWVGPGAGPSQPYGIDFRSRTDGSYPTGPSDGVLQHTAAGQSYGQRGTSTLFGMTNDTDYHFGAYADNGAGTVYSAGRFGHTRPFATTGKVKWAYTTGGIAVGTPGVIRGKGVWSASNDRMLHSMVGTSTGGDWPTAWRPYAMNAPAQDRTIPMARHIAPVGDAWNVVFAGSQDGRVYAFNADTGAILWASPVLGGAVQGSPAVVLRDNAFAFDLVIAATRTPSGDSKVYGLSVVDGTIRWTYDNGGGATGIGVINAQPMVDTTVTPYRVYFGSRAKAGGSSDTVWCLEFTDSTVTKRWSVAAGNVDGQAVRSGTTVYVGTNAGEVRAFDRDTGAAKWAVAYAAGDGPVKAYVLPSGGRLYFSTTSRVHAITDNGGSASAYWTTPVTIPSPSAPVVINGKAYVGGGDGELYEIDALTATPAVPKSVVLGDPLSPTAVGRPTYDNGYGLLYVGAGNGVIYAVQAPL